MLGRARARSVSGLPQLLPQLEGILFPIMQRMVSTEGQDVFEDVLEIVAYFTYFSPEVRRLPSAPNPFLPCPHFPIPSPCTPWTCSGSWRIPPVSARRSAACPARRPLPTPNLRAS